MNKTDHRYRWEDLNRSKKHAEMCARTLELKLKSGYFSRFLVKEIALIEREIATLKELAEIYDKRMDIALDLYNEEAAND